MRRWHLKISALSKSMVAQMVAITVLFLGWGLYAFAVQPLLGPATAENIGAPPLALSLTRERFIGALNTFVLEQSDNAHRSGRLENDPVVRAVIAANPDIRYHLRVGDKTFGNAPPAQYSRLGFARATRGIRAAAAAGLCAQAAKASADDPSGYYSFEMCDVPRFFEFSGLKNPIVTRETSPIRALTIRYWYFYNPFFTAAAGLFVIFMLVLTAHMLMIRRVATLTRSFNPEDLESRLPEKGLATEFVPLVRAVNHLMGKVDEEQRRNSFFLSAAAHEMRTPLTVLRTRLELMDEGPTRDSLIRDLRDMIDLVNQLLSLMSIGNRQAIIGVVDVVSCCRRVVEDAQEDADRHGVRLDFHADVRIWEVGGDGVLIRSAISNLVANAISFSPAGSVVEICTDANGRVSVRDHGPGITHVDPSAVFEPFVRGPVSRRGFGLGLAIVRAVARRHGGTAEAHNAVDGGAIFSVTFSESSAR